MLRDIHGTLDLPRPVNLQPILVTAAAPNDCFRWHISLLPSVRAFEGGKSHTRHILHRLPMSFAELIIYQGDCVVEFLLRFAFGSLPPESRDLRGVGIRGFAGAPYPFERHAEHILYGSSCSLWLGLRLGPSQILSGGWG